MQKMGIDHIMDFGKFKKQDDGQFPKLKRIRFRLFEEQRDFDFKVNRAIRFLDAGERVQLAVLFRGRELADVPKGRNLIDAIFTRLKDFGKVESPPSQEGPRLVCTIAPLNV